MKQPKNPLLKFAEQFKRWCTEDWLEKLVALLLACIVWMVVKERIIRSKKITLPEGWNNPRPAETR